MKALPDVLPLPIPLTIAAQPTGADLPANPERGSKQAGEPPNPKVELAAQDLKPLYDFAVACRDCHGQLAAAQGNLEDEQTKTQALSRERDATVRAARGGSVMRRVVRAAKWFAIGAAAG